MHCSGGLLLAALRLLYESPAVSGAILDVGAHVGRWAAEVLSTFGRLEYKKYAKEFGAAGDPCPPPEGHSLALYCFEPAKANFERLQDRGKRSGWQLEGFNLVRAAVSNATGKTSIWAHPSQVDPAASLLPRDDIQPSEHKAETKAVTMDLFVKKSLKEERAFLARFTVNGYEAVALAGAKKSLKQRKLRFLLFEVSPLWEAAGQSLGKAVRSLWKLGYMCFALLPEPVPLSGPFWKKDMEASGPEWFHSFCGAVEDPGLRRVLSAVAPASHDWLALLAPTQ